jgi:hypothetical protein
LSKTSFNNQSATATSRDSQGTSLSIGYSTHYKGLIYADITYGIIKKNYNSNALQDITRGTGTADIHWNISRLSTINFDLNRTVEDDVDTAEGFTRTDMGLSVDHELRRNVIIALGARRKISSFDDSGREDIVTRGFMKLDYTINPYLTLGTEIGHGFKESNAPSGDYTRNDIMLRLTGRL